MPNLDLDTALGLSLRFSVTLDGYDLGNWSQVSGLDVKFDLLEYREGSSDSNFRYYVPGLTHYSNIKMVRALNPTHSATVGKWLTDTTFANKKHTGVIVMFDAWKKPVFEWNLFGVMPISWSGPQFDAGGSKVGTETLEIAHQGWLNGAEGNGAGGAA